eukprot:CAMPEP_0181330618 /NCGR_PEP_ID=MMETSP1101-20121128/24003_1 /TAXON_ID=46948 /ORGANISM="Rhodomonas abbreviata, Strain Caron Lab Isolate" /LENGTH=1264 /DNA_ID=CAMNT_0023439901 /DNA_START=106 /DNA_END=3900 /DNA_ORIENTATION=-
MAQNQAVDVNAHLSHEEKLKLYDYRRRFTAADAVDFPKTFTVISENQWGNIPRLVESFDQIEVCNGVHKHEGRLCDGTHCIGWETMVECKLHEPGVDCKNMNFRYSHGKTLKLYPIGNEYGVFCLKGAKKHDFLVEFLGNMVWESDIDASNCYYVILDGEVYIDGSTHGSIASFVNHSCNPNCSLQVWWVPVGDKYEPRVGLFAIRDIDEGEALFFEYRMVSFIANTIRCYCGSKSKCKTYVNTEASRKRFKKITRHVTNAVHARSSERMDARESLLSSLKQVGPDGEYEPHVSQLMLNVNMFRGVSLEDPAVAANPITEINKVLTRNMMNFQDVVVYGDWAESHSDQSTLKASVFGIPFVGKGKTKSQCKRKIAENVIRVFQSVAPHTVPHAVKGVVLKKTTVSVDAPARTKFIDLKTVYQTFHIISETFQGTNARIHKEFAENEIKPNAKIFELNAVREQQLLEARQMLCMSANELFPTPFHFMQYFVTKNIRMFPILDPFAQHLATRNKKIEIGGYCRLHTTYHNILGVKNEKTGPFLVLLGKMFRGEDLQEVLNHFEVELTDIADEELFKQKFGTELTNDSLHSRVTSETERSRSPAIYGARIRSILWPIQTVAEFYDVLKMLEDKLGETTSPQCLKQLKSEMRKVSINERLGVSMNVSPNDANSWSSMVIATQMQMSESEYKTIVSECQDSTRLLRRKGVAWMPLSSGDCTAIRKIVVEWIAAVDAGGDMRGESRRKRNIASWVDEIGIYPGGVGSKRDGTLREFLARLCGMTLEESSCLDKLCEKPLKGLSPIARTEAGRCFQYLELYMVVLAEIRCGERNLTMSAFVALASAFGTRIQGPHLDAQRKHVMVCGIPLNKPNEGPFDATLVADMPIDFAQLYNAPDEADHGEKFSSAFVNCYRDMIDLPPDEFLAKMKPAVKFFSNSGFLVTLGNLLHCGPGNFKLNAETVRLIVFAVTGIEGTHYDGVHQLFWDQLIGQVHGHWSFWVLLHVAEFSLVDGIHVQTHYWGTSVAGVKDVQWKQAKMTKLDRGQILDMFVTSVRILCNPHNFDSAFVPLKGQPIRSKKRQADEAGVKREYGTMEYSRVQVRKTVVTLWRYMTAVNDDKASQVLRGFFKRFEMGDVKDCDGHDYLIEMRRVFQLISPNSPHQKGTRDSFGVDSTKDAVNDQLEALNWMELTKAAMQTAGAAQLKKAAVMKSLAGFRMDDFVLFERDGTEMRGIVTGYTPGGEIEVLVANPEPVEVVVKKELLKKVNPVASQ